MSLLTKEDFREFYGYSIVHIGRLIKSGKLKINKNGLIDTNNETNAEFCKARKEQLQKQSNKKTTKTKQIENKQPSKNQKSADQLALEIDLLNARLEEKNQKAELTKIKIAKEKREVVETDVLNRCIQETFGDMIKRLTELPSIYAGDIIKFVQTEDNPKELIVEYLTQKISNTLKQGLQAAKEATKKYYGESEYVEQDKAN